MLTPFDIKDAKRHDVFIEYKKTMSYKMLRIAKVIDRSSAMLVSEDLEPILHIEYWESFKDFEVVSPSYKEHKTFYNFSINNYEYSEFFKITGVELNNILIGMI